MSITLVAYPMAFLINPEDAKSQKLRMAADEVITNKTVATQNLKKIRVLTNITYDEVSRLMCQLGAPEQRFDMPYFMDTESEAPSHRSFSKKIALLSPFFAISSQG